MSARAEHLQQRAPAWVQPAAIALGCGALAAQHPSYPSVFGVFIVGALGLFGARTRVARGARFIGASCVGVAAFAITRAFASPIGISISAGGLVFLAFAAIAEELFFRKYVYGYVEARAGAGVAIGISAALFAIVHLPTYGWGAMPVDLAAGALLGWQRWASGTWTSSAITHVFANFLQVG